MSYQKQIAVNNKTLTFEINSKSDEIVFNEIFNERGYRILDDIIKRASVPIIDIGAHIGMFSAYAAALNDTVRIFAYEPDEQNYQAMKVNLKLNRFKNVVTKNLAIGLAEGKRVFYLNKDSHNHSLFEINDIGIREFEDSVVGQKEVLVTTLARIFEQQRLEKVSLIKLDSEGAEFEILENLDSAIFDKIGAFYVEYHVYKPEMDPNRLKNILMKHGFKVEMRGLFYQGKMGYLFAKR